MTAALPLEGFTVALTAARRREELGALLERRGARVVQAPAIRIVPLDDDAELLAATKECVDHPPDIAVATTGIGFRGWMEAADGWGLGEPLLDRLGSATLLARGPKTRGAIRAAGLVDDWSPASESSAEVLDHLLAQDLQGRRIAVQLHGEPLPDFTDALEAAGATVVPVPVYRWVLPDDVAPLERLIESVVSRGVDCVAFTSAPAVASLMSLAEKAGMTEEIVSAFRADVVPACVGPVTAARLERIGITTTQPQRARLGALVREIVAELPARCRTLRVAGHDIQIRGHAVLVDATARELPPGPMAVLRELVRRPGVVVSRAELLGVLPGGGSDEHAVEMAITRLRGVLGSKVVQTVVKRGYRLAYEPESAADKYGEPINLGG
ncbi:uroporphyrinogen-III synthase [Phytoactinopolyspora mesophila]|uniref:Uroporphyrinogen-III synthase n=1 Tax=Phytoactinopolyspora mesophila TaxID=2650750 RepID=A0A7K3MBS9_9ACTN|nr:uroporphyrinogen-III synthase [Phytoactinopolyspora mesophila]NDL60769.1 uroporphyrinogen-III synthase [Phytoactinopolyspora mesophila]